ncbi:hypothetical protein [Klebsiella phage Kp_GWPR59]|nr:hypothetical protein [Klebsiella phage Kp_GWPR59]
MITIVYWEELESEFSDEAGEMAAVAGESEMLTATESIDDAFDRIKKHQKENEGRDIFSTCYRSGWMVKSSVMLLLLRILRSICVVKKS